MTAAAPGTGGTEGHDRDATNVEDQNSAEMTAALAALAPLLPPSPKRLAEMRSVEALKDAAFFYASVGWPVFPLRPGEKRPLTQHGFKEATTDPRLITAWWTTWPDANIGVPTGLFFDVIDIDAPDGFVSWAAWQDERQAAGRGSFRPLGITETGNGGRHFLIRPTDRRNSVRIRPHIDYRGAGGFIVVPPSRLANGGLYRWVKAPDPSLVPTVGAA